MCPSHYRKASLCSSSAHPDQARPRCSILWRHWTVPIAARLLSRSGCHWPVAVGGGALSQRARRVHLPIYNLLPQLTALENILVPMLPKRRSDLQRAGELLDAVGLGDRARHRPSELSGGEQQRVAIARALVNDPALILADEPVGNLDDENADKIATLLASACRERGRTLILVTHDRNLIHPVDHVFDMRAGSLTSMERVFAS